MNDFSCKHGALKYIPAGVSSRTGNAYNGFWKCERDECFLPSSVRNGPERFAYEESLEPPKRWTSPRLSVDPRPGQIESDMAFVARAERLTKEEINLIQSRAWLPLDLLLRVQSYIRLREEELKRLMGENESPRPSEQEPAEVEVTDTYSDVDPWSTADV